MVCEGGYNNVSLRWIARYLECVIQYQCSLQFSDADVTAGPCSGSSKCGAAAPPISPWKHYKHPRHGEEENEEEEEEEMDKDVMEEELDEDSTQCEFFSTQLMYLISDACPSDQLPQTKCRF